MAKVSKRIRLFCFTPSQVSCQRATSQEEHKTSDEDMGKPTGEPSVQSHPAASWLGRCWGILRSEGLENGAELFVALDWHSLSFCS